MVEGKVAGTFTARITLRKPLVTDDAVDAEDASVRLPTGVGLEALIADALQSELREHGSLLLVSSVHVERTDA